jgi:adenylate cyclase
MNDVTLDTIRECFEGVIPAVLGTADLEGMPNVSYLSQVQYMDREHVALSYQFFNKTRSNILANPHARLTVVNPYTGAQYSLALRYLRTETSGKLFESMKAKLAGLASHTGMSGVFKLLGSDVFRVTEIACVDRDVAPPPPPQRNMLAALRLCSERLLACRDLAQLFDETMACLDGTLGISHAMLLLQDPGAGCLYTVASHGYAQSGVGSEIPLGQGVIGVAAREGTPIRISHMTAEYSYSRAIRQQTEGSELAARCRLKFPILDWPNRAASWRCRYRAANACWVCCTWRARWTCVSATTMKMPWSRCAASWRWRCTSCRTCRCRSPSRRCWPRPRCGGRPSWCATSPITTACSSTTTT